MSGRIRTVLMCAVVMLACPLASRAQDAAAGPKRPQPDMMAMDKAFRALNAQIKDATQNAASLAAVAQMQAATVAAKDGMPPLVAALPAAEQAARIVEYKKELDKLLRQEIDLEEQLLNGDNAKAADTLAAMQATQQEGHRGFRPQRGRGPGGGAPGGGAPGGGAAGGGGGRRGAGTGAPPTP
jgi:soluble cytochrome b562